ncbi:MAG TPA: hypothetical protein VI072_22420 [Polyangiaceae bacterium]
MGKTWAIVLGTLTFSCGGPSSGGQDVKTPEEIVAEQEQLGAEQEKKAQQHPYTGPVGETELEQKQKWDKKQAELELKRAARSAETCPASVTEQAPKGTGKVSLTFANDGHVKTSSIDPPYDDTAVGKCVLRAMAAVIVPSFEGQEEAVQWEVDLTADGPPPEKPAGKDKPKKSAK